MEKLSNFVTKAVERRFAPKRRTAFTPCRASVCAAQAHRHRTAAPRRRAVPGMASRAVFSVRSPACLAEPGFARHLAEAPRRFCVRQRLFAARCPPAPRRPRLFPPPPVYTYFSPGGPLYLPLALDDAAGTWYYYIYCILHDTEYLCICART